MNCFVTITSKCMSFTTNSTGGEYKHLLSLNELPSHAHSPHEWSLVISEGGNSGAYHMDNSHTDIVNIYKDDPRKDRNTSYAGGNEPHNIVQPYVTVSFWKRIN